MIQITYQPLPDPEAERIRNWLNQPEALEYERYLASMAATAVAEAGVILSQEDRPVSEDRNREADVMIDMAHSYQDAIKCLRQMRDKEYQFQTATLSPEPLTITEQQ